MPSIVSLFKLLKYAPMAIQVARAVRGGKGEVAAEDEVRETRDELADLKKNLTKRLEALEEERSQLKTRIKELDEALSLFKVLVWTSGGVAIIAFVLALIALIAGHGH